MIKKELSFEDLKQLEQYDTPTLSNAMERFNFRRRIDGFTNPSIKEIIPHGKTFIGYACTAKISAAVPAKSDPNPVTREYFESFQKSKRPTISVIEDIDAEPVGSFWGAVNATVHKALGCIATITNGGVRDLKEVSGLGFGYYASCILVSHGYVHIEDCNCSVSIGELEINPGDLIAADQHGVILIPSEIAPELLDSCRKTAEAELAILEGCRRAILGGREISVDDLMDWREKMYKLRSN